MDKDRVIWNDVEAVSDKDSEVNEFSKETGGFIAVRNKTVRGTEGKDGYDDGNIVFREDEECLGPKAGAKVESQQPDPSVGGVRAEVEAARAPAAAEEELREEAGGITVFTQPWLGDGRHFPLLSYSC